MKIAQAFTIAALLAGSTAAYAQDVPSKHAREFRASVPAAAFQQQGLTSTNPYQDSGTIGRLNLGASPEFPEGPGNPHK